MSDDKDDDSGGAVRRGAWVYTCSECGWSKRVACVQGVMPGDTQPARWTRLSDRRVLCSWCWAPTRFP